MFEKAKRYMFPIPLSRALEIANRVHGPESQTWRWYSTPVNQLIKMTDDAYIASITEEHLHDWYQELARANYSPWTVDSYTRAMKAFWRRLVEMGHLEESPADCLRLRKLPKKEPKDISLEDIDKMIQYSAYQPREHAIVLVLAQSGCRVGELVSMMVSGVTYTEDGGRAIVSGKMYKTRFIFFATSAADALKWYVKSRPWNAADELWLSRSGSPLSISGVYQALRRVSKRAGLEGNGVKRFNPHAFRHAYAKRLIDEGASNKLVSELLGHEDITTTLNMYVTHSDEELQQLHGKYTRDW